MSHSGSIPPAQRRLTIVLAAVFVVLVVGGSLVGNALAGTPIDWLWMIAGTAFITLLFALFLWVRLSD
ncbi:hypothetical protein GIS00_08020 [Nakamurella sp. YIM 132087]|uniref:Uncharacterized protein n=1 Tax=Nakamurella alba TaxID=2665158 RepID=A0A7K1FID2_9ACTN|nr:hypothetical protein [Nakamurella alba]MTD13887.1 hypothetical protein [Nakamurella alba]